MSFTFKGTHPDVRTLLRWLFYFAVLLWFFSVVWLALSYGSFHPLTRRGDYLEKPGIHSQQARPRRKNALFGGRRGGEHATSHVNTGSDGGDMLESKLDDHLTGIKFDEVGEYDHRLWIDSADAKTGASHDGPAASLKPAADESEFVSALDAHAEWQSSMGSGSSEFDAVVYACTAEMICGGMVDRFEGILVTYIWAVTTGKAFYIQYCKPGRLENYYMPNKLDWRMETLSEPRRLLVDQSQRVFIRRHTEDGKECDVLIKRLVALSADPVVRVTTNHARSCVNRLLVDFFGRSTLNFSSTANIMSYLFERLFRPAPGLLAAADAFVQTTSFDPHKAMCFHVRYGGIHVNHKRYEHIRYNDLDVFRQCAIIALDVLEQRRIPMAAWLVASDDSEALSVVKGKLSSISGMPVFDTSSVGPDLHVDKYAIQNAGGENLGLTGGIQRSAQIIQGHAYRIKVSSRNPGGNEGKASHGGGWENYAAADLHNTSYCPEGPELAGEARVFLDHFLLSQCAVLIGSRGSGFSLSAAALGNSGSLFFSLPQDGMVEYGPTQPHRGKFCSLRKGGTW